MKRMIAAAMLVLPGLALGQEMRPGLWEYTTTVAMPGVKGAAQKHSSQHCVTPQEVKDKSAFKSQLDPKMGCSMSDFRQNGSQFSYKVACKGEMKMTGSVSGNATPEAMNMNMEMDMSGMKGMGAMRQSISARRIGECKPKG